jgi:glutamate/tyrosine decarboxylase-like PLP-dependent enzyme
MTLLKDLEKELDRLAEQSFKEQAEPRKAITQKAFDYADAFIRDMEQTPSFFADKQAKEEVFRFDEHGESFESILEQFKEEIVPTGINAASFGHLGYIPGGGIYEAALGDYLADVTNRYAGVFFASPGAVRMENALIRWVGKLVGYAGNFGGNLSTGGSIANLIGIGAAKYKFGLKGPDLHKHVIYLSAHTHHCIPKALRITGLEECVIRHVPLDKQYRMLPEAFDAQVQADKRSGLVPFLLIASAGTTDVGAVDPMDALADVCEKQGIWFHIDGAYGGFFLLTSKGRALMKGMHRADSVILDPHKSLFLPYGLGMVLVKDAENLKRANTFTANYMQDTQGFDLEDSPADMSPELTKHWRGLRMWLPLKYHGIAPFRATLEEKLLLAQYAWHKLEGMGCEMGPRPQLSVLIFRFPKANEEETEAYNRTLLKAIHADGRYFISSTLVDGTFYLRLAILSFRTHRKHIDAFFAIMEELKLELEAKV